jgi:hypothetical protein
MPTYAKDTSVTADQSLIEIKRILERYGAIGFIHGWDMIDGIRYEAVEFKMRERRVRFVLALPDQKDREFQRTPTGRTRIASSAREAWDQAVRQRWRALALAIKAKLESVEAGIESFDEAFMPQLVQPNGATFGSWAVPQIAVMYEQGTMPPLLPMLGEKE